VRTTPSEDHAFGGGGEEREDRREEREREGTHLSYRKKMCIRRVYRTTGRAEEEEEEEEGEEGEEEGEENK
jgi:hypothetical protein